MRRGSQSGSRGVSSTTGNTLEEYQQNPSGAFRQSVQVFGDVRVGDDEHSFVRGSKKVRKNKQATAPRVAHRGSIQQFFTKAEFHKRRPKIFVVNPLSKKVDTHPVRFGTDAFKAAGITGNLKAGEHPLVRVSQRKDGSVVIQRIGDLRAEKLARAEERRRKAKLGKAARLVRDSLRGSHAGSTQLSRFMSSYEVSKTDAGDEDKLDNYIDIEDSVSDLEIHAGSWTMRNDLTGFLHGFFLSMRAWSMIKPKQAMRLASVVLPIIHFKGTGEEYLMITQRAGKRYQRSGVYNSMWVFPGGHVEASESLSEGGAREVSEETGLKISADDLKPLCCWQEFVIALKRQYIIMVYYTKIELEAEMTQEDFLSILGIQLSEVRSVALIPKKVWSLLAVRQKKNNPTKHYENRSSGILTADFKPARQEEAPVEYVAGVTARGKNVKVTQFPINQIYGHGNWRGCGAPHRWAVQRLLTNLYGNKFEPEESADQD